jgi:integrase
MSLRKRNDRWEVRIRVGSGRRVEKTLPPGATKDDALAVEASYRRAKIDGVVGRKVRRTIADAMDRWEETGARKLRSWQKDLRFRAGVIRQLAGRRLIDDLPELANDIKRHGLDTDLSKAGVNRYIAIVRRVANLCEEWGWTDKPLGRRIKLLEGEHSRDMRVTPDQVRALMSKADPVLADFLHFLALTGLRRSEALRLTAGDLVGDAIRVDSRSKSGKPRLVPLAPEAARIARGRLPFDLTVSQVVRLWIEARKAAKLPGIRLHDLRHFFGSMLVERGADAATVRDLMGHSSLAVTSRYVHGVPDAAVRAVRGLSVKGGGRMGAGKQAEKRGKP